MILEYHVNINANLNREIAILSTCCILLFAHSSQYDVLVSDRIYLREIIQVLLHVSPVDAIHWQQFALRELCIVTDLEATGPAVTTWSAISKELRSNVCAAFINK